MIFSELYSVYYNAVARILKAACGHPLTRAELRGIVEREAFGESLLRIEPALLEERWQLLNADGTTPLRHEPTMPLTLLQKKWLKAISLDPRIRLFPGTVFDDPDTEPLFRPEDIDVFDRYADGDPYEDETYIRHFRLVLAAVRDRIPLEIRAVSPKSGIRRYIVVPDYLEYSEKDDKFRLAGHASRRLFINVARIASCVPYGGDVPYAEEAPAPPEKKTLELELTDERNALERALMHFAHFEKKAVRLDRNRYRISVTYSPEDETEMLIRVLAFGPLARVASPPEFTDLVKARLARQMAAGL